MSDFELFIDAIKNGSDKEIENNFKLEYLEKKDKDSWRPLHHACRYGRVGLVKLLLSNYCKINSRTKDEDQAIHLACNNDHIDVVKILIANECDINASDKNGYQPIHWACKNGNIDIVKILITKKCDVSASNKWGFRSIHFACIYGHIDIVEILIANAIEINVSEKINGYQPIHYACRNGHTDIVKILIANKCDINASDKWKYKSIHFACENDHSDIVKILIENNCDINASDKINEYQPIHLACENGHIDIVKILIANNCDMNALTKEGKSPIDISRKKGHQQIIDAIVIESIIKSLNLDCKIGCEHRFCRKSLENETFKKGEYIGSGAFGEVYKYKISNTNREIVIKQTKYNKEDKKNIEGNINKYSSQILHRNIVRYFGALEKSGKLCIYMEYVPGGTLKDLIDISRWIELSKVIKFTKQILEGLQFIHSQGIIHRDIKPENMLLDYDATLKLTDFGISRSLRIASIFESTKMAITFCGTPNYLAPEVFLGEPYDFPADIWSIGASIVHMITGQRPYHLLQAEAVMFKIGTTKKIKFKPCQPISRKMKSFINYLFTPKQSKRPTAEFLLKHSIFKDVK